MSLHRATFLTVTALLTAGTGSAALADCCNWGTPAPVTYVASGCGGCGTAAPVVYAVPVAPAPIVVSGCGGCGTVRYVEPAPVMSWDAGCGCNHALGAPSPVYVVNQGPAYSGPGIMVPYRTYAPGGGYARYPYIRGYHRHYGYGPHFAYRGPMYGHSHMMHHHR